jgi:hypothetical protein
MKKYLENIKNWLSDENESQLKNAIRFPVKFFLMITLTTLAIAFIALSLTWILLLVQYCAGHLGYTFIVPEELQKTILAGGAALAVAIVALHGVKSQNISAEMRHKTDKELDLKKEIFLETSEELANYMEYLISSGKENVSESERNEIIKKSNAVFNRLHLVANENTIFALTEAVKEWAYASFLIALIPPQQEDATEFDKAVMPIDKILKIQKYSENFSQKIWEFNITARRELKNEFKDSKKYLDNMEKNQNELYIFIKSTRTQLEKLHLEEMRDKPINAKQA